MWGNCVQTTFFYHLIFSIFVFNNSNSLKKYKNLPKFANIYQGKVRKGKGEGGKEKGEGGKEKGERTPIFSYTITPFHIFSNYSNTKYNFYFFLFRIKEKVKAEN